MGNKQDKNADSTEKKESSDFIEKRANDMAMVDTKRHVLEQLSEDDTPVNTSITSGGVAFYMPLDDSMGSTPTRPLLPPKRRLTAESKSDTYTLEERTLMAEVMNREILQEKVRKARTSEERRQKVMERRERQDQEKREKYIEKMNMIEEKRKVEREKMKNRGPGPKSEIAFKEVGYKELDDQQC